MHSKRVRWTLICYAGSASEASIGSKPIGTELLPCIGLLPPARQASSSRTQASAAQEKCQIAKKIPASYCYQIKNYQCSGTRSSCRPTATLLVLAQRRGAKASAPQAEYGPRQP